MISTTKELVKVLVFPSLGGNSNVVKEVTLNINSFDPDYPDIIVQNPITATFDIGNVSAETVTIDAENLPQLTDQYNVNVPSYVDLRTEYGFTPYVATPQLIFSLNETKVTSIPFTVGGSTEGRMVLTIESQESFNSSEYDFVHWYSRTPGGPPEFASDTSWASYYYASSLLTSQTLALSHDINYSSIDSTKNHTYIGTDHGVRYYNACILKKTIENEPGYNANNIHGLSNWYTFIGREAFSGFPTAYFIDSIYTNEDLSDSRLDEYTLDLPPEEGSILSFPFSLINTSTARASFTVINNEPGLQTFNGQFFRMSVSETAGSVDDPAVNTLYSASSGDPNPLTVTVSQVPADQGGAITGVNLTDAGEGHTPGAEVVPGGGSGQGAQFTVTQDESANITGVQIVEGGYGYQVGDTFQITSLALGGQSPAIFEVTSVSGATSAWYVGTTERTLYVNFEITGPSRVGSEFYDPSYTFDFQIRALEPPTDVGQTGSVDPYSFSFWKVTPGSLAPETVTYRDYTLEGNGNYLIAGVNTNEEIISSAYELVGGDDYYDTNLKPFVETQLDSRRQLSGTVEYDFNLE